MSNKFKNSFGFTAIDNDIFFLQSLLSASEFSLLLRVFRATHGYGEPVKALSGAYLRKTTNLSKNTVTNAAKKLESLGILLIKRRSKSVSLYQISVKAVEKLAEEVRKGLEEYLELDETENQEVLDERAEEEPEIKPEKDNSFDIFWDAYDKKKNKSECQTLWGKLSKEVKLSIMRHLEIYVPSTPEKQFRKDPANYLKYSGWEDEVVGSDKKDSDNKREEKSPPRVTPPQKSTRDDVIKEGTEADKRVNDFLKQYGRKTA